MCAGEGGTPGGDEEKGGLGAVDEYDRVFDVHTALVKPIVYSCILAFLFRYGDV